VLAANDRRDTFERHTPEHIAQMQAGRDGWARQQTAR